VILGVVGGVLVLIIVVGLVYRMCMTPAPKFTPHMQQGTAQQTSTSSEQVASVPLGSPKTHTPLGSPKSAQTMPPSMQLDSSASAEPAAKPDEIELTVQGADTAPAGEDGTERSGLSDFFKNTFEGIISPAGSERAAAGSSSQEPKDTWKV
jgi:predicted lipid-binding transport protein (Tim44 family)